MHWAALLGQIDVVKLLCEWYEKNPDKPENQKADPNILNAFNRKPMEEALQSGKVEIAEYLAPRTVLDDNKTYSTIHESQIYQDEDGSGDEEEKKGSGASDTRSFQSEEGMRPDDYQRTSAAEKQSQVE